MVEAYELMYTEKHGSTTLYDRLGKGKIYIYICEVTKNGHVIEKYTKEPISVISTDFALLNKIFWNIDKGDFTFEQLEGLLR